MRPEFAFRHDRRFFFRHHRPRFVSVFNFGAFGVSYCYPYDYGYPYDYSYDEAGAGYDGQYWNDVAVAVQSELARRGYYHQAPTGGAISSDNSQPQGSSYGPHYADTSYGVATAGEQQTHFRPEPNKPAAPRADPPRANASRPATLAAAVPAAHGSVLDRLVLVSWLADSRKDVIFVEDTETNEVHQITSEPNKDHLRIVEMHLNANPKLTEVVISNGREQGPVKFRFETPTAETSPASPAPLVKDAPGQTPTE